MCERYTDQFPLALNWASGAQPRHVSDWESNWSPLGSQAGAYTLSHTSKGTEHFHCARKISVCSFSVISPSDQTIILIFSIHLFLWKSINMDSYISLVPFVFQVLLFITTKTRGLHYLNFCNEETEANNVPVLIG